MKFYYGVVEQTNMSKSFMHFHILEFLLKSMEEKRGIN